LLATFTGRVAPEYYFSGLRTDHLRTTSTRFERRIGNVFGQLCGYTEI
jgi:hypothetical protein